MGGGHGLIHVSADFLFSSLMIVVWIIVFAHAYHNSVLLISTSLLSFFLKLQTEMVNGTKENKLIYFL